MAPKSKPTRNPHPVERRPGSAPIAGQSDGRRIDQKDHPKSDKKPSNRPSGSKNRTQKKHSKDSRWIYGLHAVGAALANPKRRCRRLVLTSPDLMRAHHDYCIPEIMGRDKLAALLPEGAVHQGAALLADPLAPPSLVDICDRNDAKMTVLVLDQVTDPRNLGAILRSAAAFGVAAVIVQDRHAPEITGTLAKAASGAVEMLPPVRVANLARAVEQLGEAGFWRLGLDGATDATLADARPKAGWTRTALVLGAEGKGLRPLVARSCDEAVRIPIAANQAGIDSLNVASAAAVALYELQRGLHRDR